MTKCNSLNVMLSNLQLNKLKSVIKNETKAVLKLSSNMVGNPNDKNKCPHKLLLTNTQVAKLRKAFANNSPVNIKLSKTQLSKMKQSGRFLGRLLGWGLTDFTNLFSPNSFKKNDNIILNNFKNKY